MNINLNKSLSLSFSAKNQSIKKADDIQRRARREFPMVGPSYIDMFYISPKKNDTAEYITKKLDKKLTTVRSLAKGTVGNRMFSPRMNLSVPYVDTLAAIKKLKVGNCSESVAATIATLAANGIYDAQRANLFYQVELINKNTGKSECKSNVPLDHTFVISSMGKNSNNEKDLVVLDSWLGIADSISKAKEKYNELFPDKYLSELEKMSKSLFRVEQAEKGRNINLDDYSVKSKFVFIPAQKFSYDEMENLDIYTNMFYPQLSLRKN